MLGAASPTLSGISQGMGQSSMTPRLLLTFSACNKFETIITSLMTALTASLLLQSHQGSSLLSWNQKEDFITWTLLAHNPNNRTRNNMFLQ